MHVEGQAISAMTRANALRPEHAFLLVTGLMSLVVLLHLPTARSMASIWSGSEIFTHGWVVIPISLWFIWGRRDRLARTIARSWWVGVAVICASGMLWLIGTLSGSQSPAQFGLVGMAIGAVLAVTGPGWGRELAFPLAFLVFAVPFGDFLIPTLIDWTADFTVIGLQLSGVPVFREGNDFAIPSGRWSVVEACSGVRYLLASMMVGTVYAWLTYRTPLRRLAFIGASLAVPLVANWLRAYLIVMLGHLSDNRLAAGVDHLIYGWVFFGIVIFTMFAVGARWREQDVHHDSRVRVGAPIRSAPPWVGALTAVVALVVWPALSHALSERGDRRPVQPVAIEALDGWHGAAPDDDWRPTLRGSRAQFVQTFEREGDRVTVHVGFFRDQQQHSELVNAGHSVAPESGAWRQVSLSATSADLDGRAREWRDFVLRDQAGRYVRVWMAYWIGEGWTISDARAKGDLVADRMRGRTDTGAWVAISTVHRADDPKLSSARLRDFIGTMGRTLERALEQTAVR
jgi:exosortase A